eukprot:TRINITY_DN1712_c0_g1_i1.p1 TRINITY_DN1712_c0_g1~~TRINITY_DN1712_c0_g1_i1.p1  ORF type:complete len:200 (+),score=4.17 TRINITY_DN1712_c0_g1_i1:650-1249(+)
MGNTWRICEECLAFTDRINGAKARGWESFCCRSSFQVTCCDHAELCSLPEETGVSWMKESVATSKSRTWILMLCADFPTATLVDESSLLYRYGGIQTCRRQTSTHGPKQHGKSNTAAETMLTTIKRFVHVAANGFSGAKLANTASVLQDATSKAATAAGKKTIVELKGGSEEILLKERMKSRDIGDRTDDYWSPMKERT